MTLAVVTIGQAPRTDFTADLLPRLPAGVVLAEYGALDDLTFEEATALCAPQAGEAVLVSRMRDGRQITVGEQGILPRVQACIAHAERDGAGAVLLLCTGHFAALAHSVPLIRPEPLEHATALALADGRAIAVMVPDEAQAATLGARWRAHGGKVHMVCASPYLGEAAVEAAAATLRGCNAALVCLDCMGYTLRMKALVAAASGLPVLLPRTLAVAIACEILMEMDD